MPTSGAFTLHSLPRTHAQIRSHIAPGLGTAAFSSAGGPITALFSSNQIVRYNQSQVIRQRAGQPIWCFELVVFRGGCGGRASFAARRRREIPLAKYLAAAGNQLIPPIFANATKSPLRKRSL